MVNRIAAGEVVQRPANAVKELLENAYDAGATAIGITVRDGGLRSFSVRDNGHGISRGDLPLLCVRHATSKLTDYDQLAKGQVATFGFRGEALASVSYVSHLSVVTRKEETGDTGERMGLSATYRDGSIESTPAEVPWPHEELHGTTITCENLFYNAPQRRSSLRSHAEEFARILQVCMAYSCGRLGVGISLRKEGAASYDLQTTQGMSTRAAVRRVYGNEVADSLLDINRQTEVGEGSQEGVSAGSSKGNDETVHFRVEGVITKPEYRGKRAVFLCVRCTVLASVEIPFQQ